MLSLVTSEKLKAAVEPILSHSFHIIQEIKQEVTSRQWLKLILNYNSRTLYFIRFNERNYVKILKLPPLINWSGA
jgi:hypothetical protein